MNSWQGGKASYSSLKITLSLNAYANYYSQSQKTQQLFWGTERHHTFYLYFNISRSNTDNYKPMHPASVHCNMVEPITKNCANSLEHDLVEFHVHTFCRRVSLKILSLCQ